MGLFPLRRRVAYRAGRRVASFAFDAGSDTSAGVAAFKKDDGCPFIPASRPMDYYH